jgi:hypothetical protein
VCSLEQADGLFEFERGGVDDNPRDLFHAAGNASFDDTTLPDSRWWDRSESGLAIHDIGPAGKQVKFSTK